MFDVRTAVKSLHSTETLLAHAEQNLKLKGLQLITYSYPATQAILTPDQFSVGFHPPTVAQRCHAVLFLLLSLGTPLGSHWKPVWVGWGGVVGLMSGVGSFRL